MSDAVLWERERFTHVFQCDSIHYEQHAIGATNTCTGRGEQAWYIYSIANYILRSSCLQIDAQLETQDISWALVHVRTWCGHASFHDPIQSQIKSSTDHQNNNDGSCTEAHFCIVDRRSKWALEADQQSSRWDSLKVKASHIEWLWMLVSILFSSSRLAV